MSEAEHLSDVVRALFVSNDHGLFTSFASTVAGDTAAQAATVPAPRFNRVWAIANHVRFWQELTLLRLKGQTVDRATLGAENQDFQMHRRILSEAAHHPERSGAESKDALRSRRACPERSRRDAA